MKDEDFLRRPPAPCAYVEGKSVLWLPEQALGATLGLLRAAGNRESGCIWYGARGADGSARVSVVMAPQQRMSPFNYHISAAALTTAVRQLSDDLRPLAQVHSHPGMGVEHSRYDDEVIMSKRILSIVFPLYGAYPSSRFPGGAGIHEWQSEYWHLLGDDVATRRVQTESGSVQVLDLRQ